MFQKGTQGAAESVSLLLSKQLNINYAKAKTTVIGRCSSEILFNLTHLPTEEAQPKHAKDLCVNGIFLYGSHKHQTLQTNT